MNTDIKKYNPAAFVVIIFVLLIAFGVLLAQQISSVDMTDRSTAAATHELVGNGFAFTADSQVWLLPSVDMTCVIDSAKLCRKNTDDSNWFYALGMEDRGSVAVLPVELTSSWGLDPSSPPSFAQFLTPTFQKSTGYSTREVMVKAVAWGYGDPAHPATEQVTTMVEYDEPGVFAGKGDLHHLIIKNPVGDSDYLDISYVIDTPGVPEIIEELLTSIVFFYPTS